MVAALNRCSLSHARHEGRLIHGLTHNAAGSKPYKTLLLHKPYFIPQIHKMIDAGD
jgi:hypothetical protein